MKKINIITFLGIAMFALQNCSAVNKAFVSERKNSTEEFLVEKKSPLSMPPSFNELPVPQNLKQDKNVENQENDIKSLIQKTESSTSNSENNENSQKKIENSILERIKNN